MSTFRERLRVAVKHSKLSARKLSIRAGLTSPTHIGALLSSKNEPNPTNDTMAKIAEAAGVSFEWLAQGKGPGPDEQGAPAAPTAFETTPAPTSAELHEKPDTHWTTEEVEDWFLPVLQAAPPGRYTGRHVTAAKMCLRDRQMKLDKDADMVALAAGVLEAVKALDEAHRPLTNATIFHYLATQNLPAFVPTKHTWKPGDKELIDKLKEKGIEVNPDDPAEVRKERRKARLAGKLSGRGRRGVI